MCALTRLVLVLLLEATSVGAQECGPTFTQAIQSVGHPQPEAFGARIASDLARLAVSTVDSGGRVEVFRLITGSLVPQYSIVGSGDPDERFGASLSCRLSWMGVGAPGRSSGAGGATMVWHPSVGAETVSLDPGTLEPGDEFGSAIFITGVSAMVGAPGDDDRGTNAGAIYIFEREGADWVFARKYVPDELTPGARYGSQIEILSGFQATVSAPGMNRVYITDFDRDAPDWAVIDEIFMDAPAGEDAAGFGAALGHYSDGMFGVLVGAPDALGGAGRVFAYPILSFGGPLAVGSEPITIESPAPGARFGADFGGHSFQGTQPFTVAAPGVATVYLMSTEHDGFTVRRTITGSLDDGFAQSVGTFDQSFDPTRIYVAAPLRDRGAGAVESYVVDESFCRPFLRGDVNQDGILDLADGIGHLSLLIDGSLERRCDDALDSNNDGDVDIADSVTILSHLFESPRFFLTGRCAPDIASDGLSCHMFEICP